MAKVPFTEEQAHSLVKNGHLSHSTFNKIKGQGGFMQGFDEGGVVQPEAQAPDVLTTKAQYYQAQDPSLSFGDATAKAAMDIQGRKDQAAAADAAPLKAYEESMASLPKTPLDVANPSAPKIQGVTVASNDPMADRQIASQMTGAGQASPEAGHIPTSNIVGGGPTQPANGMPVAGQDYMSKIEHGMQQEQAGTQKMANAQAGAATEGAKFMSGMADEMKRQNAMDKIHEFERQDAAKQGLEGLQKMGQDIQSGKIDPNHFWATRTTGQKIMGAISLALGGIGQGLLRSNSNAAMDVINNAINHDIDAQKANLANKRAGFETQASLYGLAQKNFQDERQATLAARSLGYQAAEMKLKSIAANAQVPEIQGKAQALLGQLEVAQTKTKQELALGAWQMQAVRQAMGPGGGQLNPEFLPKEYRERYVNGMGFTKDAETRRKVEEFKGADDAFKKDLGDLRQFAIQNRGTTMDRETVNKGKAMAAALQNAYRKAESMGVYKESEATFMKNLIGDDPSTWFNYVPQLDALGNTANNARQGFYGSHLSNYQPVREIPAGGR